MTEDMPRSDDIDRRLKGRIATLMRAGTLIATFTFVAGALLGWTGASVASTTAVIAGCGVLVALPIARLFVMIGSFARRKDTLSLGITGLVIVLILVSATTGLLR